MEARVLTIDGSRQGALVSGPPGTGKAIFGRALANALDLDLISATVGEWQSAGPLGAMLARMRQCFEEAKRKKGCIHFIDEMEALGRRGVRARDATSHYWHVVVAEFLSLLSNVGQGVVVVGVTTQPDQIDAEILRAGRIERHFLLALPYVATRADILAFHPGHVLPTNALIELASELEGKSGATWRKLSGTLASSLGTMGALLKSPTLKRSCLRKPSTRSTNCSGLRSMKLDTH